MTDQDLPEAPADSRIHFEVLVPFTREGSHGRFHPEAVSEDLPDCFQFQGRRRGLERVKALHHRAEGYLASQPAALIARPPVTRALVADRRN